MWTGRRVFEPEKYSLGVRRTRRGREAGSGIGAGIEGNTKENIERGQNKKNTR